MGPEAVVGSKPEGGHPRRGPTSGRSEGPYTVEPGDWAIARWSAFAASSTLSV